ncbi:MAG: prepilin peptidase [Candidatus Micrarchaeia archaeon]|jgi:hypothetical protein
MLEIARIAILLTFTALYAYFDVFNRRSIPDKIVYISLAIGIASTLLYPLHIMELSFLIAAFVGAAGYLLYKIGLLGLGDGLELTFISLVLPIQPTPLIGVQQFGLPFVLSVFVSSGIVTIILVPIYYLKGKPLKIDKNSLLKALLVLSSYLILLLLICSMFEVRLVPTLLIILIAIFSSLIFLFEKSINESMIEWVYPSKLDEDDIIATNLMSRKELQVFRSSFKDFGRLASSEEIKAIKHIKKKIPVYKKAIPFSLFIFFGTILSLAIGNPVLLIF